MEELLHRLEAWLTTHAPALQASLNPPAPSKGGPWSRFESELGFTLPEDFRALYLAHNGQRAGRPGLFDGLPWLSLDLALSRYLDLEGELGAADWPDGWVPFAGNTTHTLVVDLGEAPAPVLLIDADGVPMEIARTLRGYLATIVSELVTGKRIATTNGLERPL